VIVVMNSMIALFGTVATHVKFHNSSHDKVRGQSAITKSDNGEIFSTSQERAKQNLETDGTRCVQLSHVRHLFIPYAIEFHESEHHNNKFVQFLDQSHFSKFVTDRVLPFADVNVQVLVVSSSQKSC